MLVFKKKKLMESVDQGVYQPGKPGKIREFQRSGKNREKSGNFVIGQGIFKVFIVNIIL
jgi:hypothetical protein